MDLGRWVGIARYGVDVIDAILVTCALVAGVLLVGAYASASSMPAGHSVIVLDERPQAASTPSAAPEDRR